MISHVYIGVNDFDHAFQFYSGVMAELALELKFCDAAKPWAAWFQAPNTRPLFIIGRPFNEGIASPGNGQMVALLAASVERVDACFRRAISLGAKCEGAPRVRPQYHEKYYGAYFRDPDGNKLCVCFHDYAGAR